MGRALLMEQGAGAALRKGTEAGEGEQGKDKDKARMMTAKRRAAP